MWIPVPCRFFLEAYYVMQVYMPHSNEKTPGKSQVARIRAILARKAKPDILKSPVVLNKIKASVSDGEKIYASLPLHGFCEMTKDEGLTKFTALYPDFKKNNPAAVKWMLDGVFDAVVFRDYLAKYFAPGERTIKKFMHAQAIYEIGIQKFVAKQRNIRLTRAQVRELETTTYEAYNDLAAMLQSEQDKIKETQAEAKRHAAHKLLTAVRNICEYDDDEDIFVCE